jgi:integrase
MKKRDGKSIPVGARVSIFLRGRTWYYNYQRNGSQVRKSLKTCSRKQALLLAQKIETELEQGLEPKKLEDATIAQARDAFCQCAEIEGRAQKTLAKYRQITGEIEAHAEKLRLTKVSELDAKFADSWRASMYRERAPKTVHTAMTILRSLIRFAVHRRMVSIDPLVGYRLKKPKRTPQPCWTPEEADQILEAAPKAYRPYLTFLRETGCRAGEAKFLTWEDIVCKEEIAHIRPKDVWKPKTGDQRVVYLSPRLLDILKALPRHGRWVFCAPATTKWPNPDRQISERRALVALKRTLARLKLVGHLHTFRHTFVSQAIARGVPASVVREWVGHIDPEVTETYIHMFNQDNRRWLTTLREDKPPKD